METMTETDRPPLPERQSTDDGAPDDGEVVFDLEALTASYGEKTALRDVTMKIPGTA